MRVCVIKTFRSSLNNVAQQSDCVMITWCSRGSRPTAGQLVKHFFVQRLIRVFRSHRQEYVTADELVHHFAIS